jgi:hypothetical protein
MSYLLRQYDLTKIKEKDYQLTELIIFETKCLDSIKVSAEYQIASNKEDNTVLIENEKQQLEIEIRDMLNEID